MVMSYPYVFEKIKLGVLYFQSCIRSSNVGMSGMIKKGCQSSSVGVSHKV